MGYQEWRMCRTQLKKRNGHDRRGKNEEKKSGIACHITQHICGTTK